MATSYTVQLTHQQLSVIIAALADLPYKTSAPVLKTLQMQVEAAAAAGKPEPDVPATD